MGDYSKQRCGWCKQKEMICYLDASDYCMPMCADCAKEMKQDEKLRQIIIKYAKKHYNFYV